MRITPYLSLFLMLLCSFIAMYAIMFANVDTADDIMLSATRTYMSFLMVCPMAIIMILFMWPMYKNKKLNYFIIASSSMMFFAFYFMLRNQVMVNDIQYMKAMIPHHSSAVLVSKHARLKDPELRTLSDSIIHSQQREIRQMKRMIERLEKK